MISFHNPGNAGTYPIRLRVPKKELIIVHQSNAAIENDGDIICGNLKDTSDCELLFNLDFSEASNAYVKVFSTETIASANYVEII